MNRNHIHYSIIPSPIGPIMAAVGECGVVSVNYTFEDRIPRPSPTWVRDDAALDEVRRQIDEWFAGTRTHFDLALDYRGNKFQCAVWQALLEIPYGQTRTYGEIAVSIGEGTAASRAVGTACGDNPLPLIIPCHRVVGAGGTLTGFSHGARGGIEMKRHLLEHEFRICPPAGTLFALM
ncbi:MAG: methylated-DNA--[protein]-cysteine S-methyltransferase [Nitratireductor sp.]